MLLRAAKEIGLDVPKTPPADPSRLDDWFLGRAPAAPPRSPPVPFFPEVHEELVRTWRAPHSSRPRPSSSPLASLDGGAAWGYEAVPQVERAVAVHLCPPGAATWRDRPHLPSRACEFSSALAGRTYHAAGQAATALHAMATLQVYQAKVLKHLHERGSDQGAMEELRAATDFALRATKVTARSLGQVMSTIVVQERHLWLTLAQMADVDKSRFLDAPISQGGLFGDTVEDFAQQFSAVQKQTEAIKHILPRRDIPTMSAGPQPPPARRRGYMTPDWQPDVELAVGAAPPASQGPVTRKRSAGDSVLRRGQPGGGENRSLGDDNINVPTPGGGPGAVTGRVNSLTSGVQAPSSLFEQRPRSVSSDSDSEPDVASAGTREEGKRCPVQSDFSPGRSSFWDQSPSPSPPRLPHCGHVGQRPFDTPGDQAGSLASASQPLAVVDSDGTSRLCDSVRQASAQVQRRPFHFCPFGHTCRSEVAVLLAKDAIEPVPPAEMKSGFYSPYFIAQKERWVKTHPGSSSPESVPSQAAVQDAHDEAHANMHSSPGLVRSHRPEGRVLSRLDPASTQTLPTVCFRGSSVSVQSASIWPLPLSPRLYESRGGCPVPSLADGHSHPQLSRRLASHSSLARSVVRTEGLGAPAPQPSGPSGQPREEQTLPSAEDLFSRCGAGLGQYDSPPHQRARAVSAEVSGVIQTQNSGPSQNISEAPGAYGSRSRSDAARPASYETASALVTRSSPEMGMAPWHTPDWRFPAVSPPVQPVVRPGLPSGRSPPGTSLQASCGIHGCLFHGLGCCMQRASSIGLLDRTSTRLQWHINCLELLAVLLALRRFRPTLRHKHVLVRTDSTATVAYINRQGGLRSRRMSQLARHLLLWSQTWLKSLRAVHIPGELNRAADQLSRQSTHPGEWRLHPETVQLIWSHFGEAQIDLFASPESSHCQRFYSLNEAPNSLGRDALAHSWPPGPKYAFPPVSLLAQTLCKRSGGRGAGSAGCAILAHPDLVSRTHFPRGSPSLENPLEERPSFSGDGHNLAPAPRSVEPARLAVIETITQSRAPSTRQAYALRWGLFVDWCSSRGEDPQRCTIAVVLSFLQEKLERRLSPSTLKVYVAAIAAYHDAVDGTSLGKHQLIVRFLRGARRVNPPRPHPIPSWDLSVALQGLREAPFEPLASVELKYLSLKTALLTALASIKRVGDLQAFSVDEACLEFGPGDSHVILRPRPGYVPKVPTTPFRDQVVNLQALPLEEADPASALLCPVRALRIYVDRTRHFRRTEQLFVCFGGQQKGNAVSKQRLAHWVVDAISLSYQNQGEPCPLGVRAHSTRSVASSYALAHGASLADICRAADITGERESGWCRLAAPFLMDPCAISLSCSLRRTWVLHAPQSGLVRSSACLCSGWVSFAQQVVATCFSIFPRDFMCSAPQLLLQYNWHPCGAPYWPPGRWEGYAHIRLLTRPPVGTRETTEGERLGYVRNPRSLKEGTETLHPLPRPDVALTPGCSSAPQQKPE
ncbi:ORF V: Enzymatic polyprotein [Labeo rohita]|uniref:ORF V: Enzymatic polyprotein n=1 Tax=Labeo rohita TaxID=84645 RepID=A0ABQ8MFC7_LABRO|nr:ORF V: Enzymatic polyprotein [Labeo rohita]